MPSTWSAGWCWARCACTSSRTNPLRRPVVRNERIGLYYLAGTAALVALAVVLRPWGLLLLGPAMSLGLVTAGLFHIGAGVFRKQRGRLPVLTSLLLWPVLLGQRLSLAYYAPRSNGWDAVTDRL